MADYDSLLRRQAGYAIDFIIGMIVEVDNPAHRPSRVGPPQLVQDVFLEDDQGRRFIVQFWDVNRGMLTGNRRDRNVEANFEPHHKGSWIRLENTAEDQRRANLKRFPSSASVSRHYQEKRAIPVVIKATKMVKMIPLLDPGMEFPAFRRTRNDKRPTRRRVPGQQPQQENDGMTNHDGGRPPQGGRPAQGGNRQSQHEGPPPAQQPKGPRPDPDHESIDRMNDVLIWCEVALLSMYAKLGKSAGLQPPRQEWLEGPIMALQICLKDKMNVFGCDAQDIQRGIGRLAHLYVSIHINLQAKYQSHQNLGVPEGFEMFKRVSTSFIGITRNKSWKLFDKKTRS